MAPKDDCCECPPEPSDDTDSCKPPEIMICCRLPKAAKPSCPPEPNPCEKPEPCNPPPPPPSEYAICFPMVPKDKSSCPPPPCPEPPLCKPPVFFSCPCPPPTPPCCPPPPPPPKPCKPPVMICYQPPSCPPPPCPPPPCPPPQPPCEEPAPCKPPAFMVCYRVPKSAKSERPKKEEKSNVKKSKSRELRASNLYVGCDCEKRNGLQDDCQRSECHGAPPCLTLPKPTCGPSEYCSAKHLYKKNRKGKGENGPDLCTVDGKSHSSNKKGDEENGDDEEYVCFPAFPCEKPPCSC